MSTKISKNIGIIEENNKKIMSRINRENLADMTSAYKNISDVRQLLGYNQKLVKPINVALRDRLRIQPAPARGEERGLLQGEDH